MKRAVLLLCTLPVLAQGAQAIHPPNIVFYAQTEPTTLGLLDGASGAIRSPGKGQFVLHLWVYRNLAYFGCDAVFQPHGAEGAYLVRFEPLSVRGPDLAKNFMRTGMGDPSSWTYRPPAAYPPPQAAGPGETLAIDLTPAGNKGRKLIGEGNRLVGYVEMPEPFPPRAAVEGQLKNLTTPEVQALYDRVLRADQELDARKNGVLQEVDRQMRSNPPSPRPPRPPPAFRERRALCPLKTRNWALYSL
jgi:hypothetical protein